MSADVLNIKQATAPEGLRKWEREFAQGVKGDAVTHNRSGVPIKPLYTQQDWSGDRQDDALGYPGQFPYTRGIYATIDPDVVINKEVLRGNA